MKAESEAELAGVMAHEIAHIAARHGTRQASRGQIINHGLDPADLHGRLDRLRYPPGHQHSGTDGFLTFSRGFEQEADLLGLQYLYKAGYDPTSFVDFFEKIQSMEKQQARHHGKVFSSHPMTDDRIKDSQKNIQEILETKPEYVVTTSEFDDVRARLTALHNRRKIDDKEDNRPSLKKAPGGSTKPIEGTRTRKKTEEEDERPTLKRRS